MGGKISKSSKSSRSQSGSGEHNPLQTVTTGGKQMSSESATSAISANTAISAVSLSAESISKTSVTSVKSSSSHGNTNSPNSNLSNQQICHGPKLIMSLDEICKNDAFRQTWLVCGEPNLGSTILNSDPFELFVMKGNANGGQELGVRFEVERYKESAANHDDMFL